MAEYASLRKIEFELCGGNLPEKYKAFVRRVLNDRNLIPAADVAPVMHAQWIEDESGIIICPKCKRGYNLIAKFTNYCPACGAKMDGGADHGEPKEGTHADNHD